MRQKILCALFLSFLLFVYTGFSQVSLSEAGEKVFDPVCEMKVDKDDDKTIQAEYDGKIYYFCSEECIKKFEASPDNYACPCPPGSKDCPHCQGKAARCPCDIEKYKERHEGHKHEPKR